MIDWVFAGQDTGSRWGADLASGVTLGEAHALIGDAVNMGCLMKGGAFAGHILDAEVVGKDEEEVGFACICESETTE